MIELITALMVIVCVALILVAAFPSLYDLIVGDE